MYIVNTLPNIILLTKDQKFNETDGYDEDCDMYERTPMGYFVL